MNYTIVDPTSFVTGKFFREEDFLANTGTADWERYRDRPVLVRGCGTTIVPPWAYMLIAARLSGVAKSIRYGNEHDNIVVHRDSTQKQ